MYLMISKYLVSNEEIDQARPDHLAFLDGLLAQGLVVAAGRQDPPAGGVILLNVDNAARAQELIAADPYVQRGLADYTAIGWNPVVGALKDHPKQDPKP